MPEQHRDFFATLSYLFISTSDNDGWSVGSVLTGPAGFINSPTPSLLRIDSRHLPSDPAAGTIRPGSAIGILGIDLNNRRRNRANGQIIEVDDGGITASIGWSFGNCAKYIQRRMPRTAVRSEGPTFTFDRLDRDQESLIRCADTFFVATRSRENNEAASGSDISHRGGLPGFIKVSDNELTIPDFPGNRFYNTLGNALGEPRASLLFLDFLKGDILQLQGTIEIDWTPIEAATSFGPERSWRFRIARGWLRPRALPYNWDFIDYSPATKLTDLASLDNMRSVNPTSDV